MITYELAKKLKEVGFLFRRAKGHESENETIAVDVEMISSGPLKGAVGTYTCCIPTLSELIEACEPYSIKLEKRMDNRTPENYLKFSCWRADCFDADDYWSGEGGTPEEAVANLWLRLNKERSEEEMK